MFAVLFSLYFVILFLLFFVIPVQSIFVDVIMGIFLIALILLWWKFPVKCDKDGLRMKYQKNEQHFGCVYRYYQCPKGHILKKRYMDNLG